MARYKKPVVQRNFLLGELREEFLERDDLEARSSSLKSGKNMKGLLSGSIEARPGLEFIREVAGDAGAILQARPAPDTYFAVIINDDSLEVYNTSGTKVHEELTVPWTSASDVWYEDFRDKVVLGSSEFLYVLTYDSGSWSLDEFEFGEATGGDAAQPYWSYEEGTTIQPSATSGTGITITASNPIFTADHVGLRIRYGGQEIDITGYTSTTVVTGDVVSELPPSFDITVDDSTLYRVGDAVVGADTNFQGVVISIAGAVLSVATQFYFEGPDNGEELSSPAGSSAINVAPSKISPLASPVWDEPLISPYRGYPRSGGVVGGRLVLLDFPSIPDLVCLSSTRDITDFEVGDEDDDAIVRRVGDNSPRWLHAVNMGDLILFADNGVYNVPAREDGVITPTNFNLVFVDNVGSSTILPVKIDDGVVFVEASGDRISAVLLDGNIYLKWSVRPMTDFHQHLISSPVALGAPALGAASSDRQMLIINGDGTLAAMTWRGSLRNENIGFNPWETEGQFVRAAPISGEYWVLVDRDVNGSTVRYLEKFSADAYVDSAVVATDAAPDLSHLAGNTVTYYCRGWDGGDHACAADGSVADAPVFSGEQQGGLNFECEVQPWPVEHINTPRIGMLAVRCNRVSVSVQKTHGFEVQTNNSTRYHGPYQAGDDITAPPPERTGVFKFSVFGNRDHPEMYFRKTRPGKFRVLAIGQEVQS